jgi:hypothetical protein
MKKIFIRSPYFIEIDEDDQTSAKIELFIWNKESTKPSTPTHTLSKNIASSTQTAISWNVSNYAKEFIKPVAPVVVSVPTEESDLTWCYMQVISYSNDLEVNDETFVCLNGYTNYSNGYNQSNLDDVVALINTDINLTTFSGFNYVNVWIEDNQTYLWEGNDDYLFTTSEAGLFKLPYDYDRYRLSIDGTIDYLFTINTQQLCEPKYTPITCTFINRYGGWQFLTFFKANMQSIETTSKEFNMLPSAVNYNVLKGQRKRFNQQGKQTIKCNTGWVTENYFELIQDLLLSDTVLLDNKPVVVKSQSSEYKTSLKDKNINYEIEFEYSFGLINDVI